MAQFESKQAAWEYYLSLDSHNFEEKQHNNIYTEAFEAGAEWEHKRLNEKAYEWLKENAFYYMRQILLMETMEVEDFIEDFHIAMEE